MVIDQLQFLDNYASLNPRFPAAFAFLKEVMAKDFEKGKHVMPNCDVPDAVYINAAQYDSKEVNEATCEAHKKYIDVQVMLDGSEMMYVPAGKLPEASTEYNEAGDCTLYKPMAFSEAHAAHMNKGSFAIFFPNELHAPSVAVDCKSVNVRKYIIKVLAD